LAVWRNFPWGLLFKIPKEVWLLPLKRVKFGGYERALLRPPGWKQFSHFPFFLGEKTIYLFQPKGGPFKKGGDTSTGGGEQKLGLG